MAPRYSPVGSPAGLNRDRVLGAAVNLIDDSGLAGLTMRRLGEYLGVEAMAVYHYVSGRDDLLDGVVGVITGDVVSVTLSGDSTDWQRYLHLLAMGLRGVAAAHPAVFPLLLTHPRGGDWWLRPPLRDPSWHHAFVTTLLRCGFRQVDCSTAYRWFTSFLAGQLIPESTSVTSTPLDDDPEAALRRAAEGQSDFDASFDALITRLASLNNRIPHQRTSTKG